MSLGRRSARGLDHSSAASSMTLTSEPEGILNRTLLVVTARYPGAGMTAAQAEASASNLSTNYFRRLVEYIFRCEILRHRRQTKTNKLIFPGPGASPHSQYPTTQTKTNYTNLPTHLAVERAGREPSTVQCSSLQAFKPRAFPRLSKLPRLQGLLIAPRSKASKPRSLEASEPRSLEASKPLCAKVV